MTQEEYHVPVLLSESMNLLALKSGGTYVDGTLGGGGHFRSIAEALDSSGTVIGIDRDPRAIQWNHDHKPLTGARVILEQGRYAQTLEIIRNLNIDGVDGILLDLGVSSRQIDDPQRGFTYRTDSVLDMRMNPADRMTAGDILRTADHTELTRILGEFGEVHNPARMAQAIISWRLGRSLETAADLKDCLAKEYGGDLSPKVLSKVFQALRIAVNGELDELKTFLARSLECLRSGGRLVVIAYHSLEDRMVKQFMKTHESCCICPPRAPVCSCNKVPQLKRINHKAILPSENEIAVNRRARSARLRGAEKV